ncbi:hypothetical protein [Rhodococcus sp. NPDC057529]|uniref:hypothetical protein n=1 Tax=Rhodococcus sp. NPDC057529 TaxID=3346158 RepID=UPI003670FF7A
MHDLGCIDEFRVLAVDTSGHTEAASMSAEAPDHEECSVSRLCDAGPFLINRNTDEIMFGSWPTSDHPSAGQ